MDTLISIGFIVLISIAGIWAINIKRKEFSKFITEEGWVSVRFKIRVFIKKIIRFIGLSCLVSMYIAGLIGIPIYFNDLFKDDTLINWFVFLYLFLGIFICYYFTGIKRRQTKNIQIIIKEDLIATKISVLNILKNLYTVIKSLLVFTLIVGVILLFGWGIITVWGWVFDSNDKYNYENYNSSYPTKYNEDCSNLEPENPYSYDTGHYAGFEWGENGNYCSGNSNSFIEGCEEYEAQEEVYNACLDN